jgi:hypothetical protein
MRICSFDSSLAVRLNENRIKFTEEEKNLAYDEIVNRLENKKEIKVRGLSYG